MESILYLEILVAVVLDLLIGDPVYRFHPVRLAGRAIEKLENPLRSITSNLRLNGFLFALIIIAVTTGPAYLLIVSAAKLDAYLGITFIKSALSVFLIYTGISIKDLKDKALEVYHALDTDNLPRARTECAMIVGRDTGDLNRTEVARAAIESVAESITDGIISPIFFALIGGAPLVMAFKAVSTLDSMVGYRNEQYEKFGWASAKIDDWANFLPARISGLLVAGAAGILFHNAATSLTITKRDCRKNPSPNSGISQAAVAGALGIALGGVNFYRGKRTKKPLIGDAIEEIRPEHIRKTINIAYASGILFLVTGTGIIAGLRYLISLV